ncbi:MAG: hypothetical protein ACFFAQ_01955 [Promethearchaeota archaeon]
MILNENFADLVDIEYKIDKEKLKTIELALEKICRDTGEDEYDSIIDLEVKFKIWITDEKIVTLNGRQIWIWVIEPFVEQILTNIKAYLKKLNLPISEFIEIVEFHQQKCIKHPEKVAICAIHKDIFQIMKEEHGITGSYLKCYEWEQIQNSELWRKVEIQITRELIADKLMRKLKT